MKYCSQCGKQVKDTANVCKYCGHLFQQIAPVAKKSGNRKKILLIIGSVFFVVCGFIAGFAIWNSQINRSVPVDNSVLREDDDGENAISSAGDSESQMDDYAETSFADLDEAAASVANGLPSGTPEYQIDLAIPPQWDAVSGFDDHDVVRVKSGSYWGLVNKRGEYVVQPKYFSLNFFYDGLAVVDYQNKFGYIDVNGHEAILPKWDNAFSFSEGYAVVVEKNKYGFIDTSGKVIIPLVYSEANAFVNGIASVKKDNVSFFIDVTGNQISENYEDTASFSDGLAAVKVKGKWGYVDQNFSVVISPKYDAAYPFVEGMGIVNQSGKQFFIDEAGTRAAAATDEVWGFVDDRATARVGEKYGYVDRATGQFAIEPQYTDVLGFALGLAPVKIGNEWVYINKNGDIILEDDYTEAYRFNDGFARVKKGGYTGMIDLQGNTAVPFEWKDTGVYSNGMLAVQNESGKWGFLSIAHSIAPRGSI